MFDKIFLINEDEARNLSLTTGSDKIHTLKINILTEGKFRREPDVIRPQFVFLGDMSVPHNKDGLLDLVENYLPIILSVFPEFKLLVIGKGGDEDIVRSVEGYHGRVEPKGFVDDLDSIFSSSIAMISPLNFGSGVKIKVIESISRGLPVIGTPISFEGISGHGVADGLLEYQDSYTLVKHIARLLTREENLEISRRAYELFTRKFSKSIVDAEYDCLLNKEMNHG